MLQGDVRAELEQESPRKAHIAGDSRLDGAQRNPPVHARMLSLVDHPEAVGLELAQNAIAADLETVLMRFGFRPGAVPAPALGCHRNLNFSHKTRQPLFYGGAPRPSHAIPAVGLPSGSQERSKV